MLSSSLPFLCWNLLCVYNLCPLRDWCFSVPSLVLFCVVFLFFKFSELSSVTQSVGGSVAGLPEVARPGLVHTGGPCCESPASPAPALQGHPPGLPRGRHPCFPSQPTESLYGFLICLLVLPTNSRHMIENVCFDASGMCLAPWGQMPGVLEEHSASQ